MSVQTTVFILGVSLLGAALFALLSRAEGSKANVAATIPRPEAVARSVETGLLQLASSTKAKEPLLTLSQPVLPAAVEQTKTGSISAAGSLSTPVLVASLPPMLPLNSKANAREPMTELPELPRPTSQPQVKPVSRISTAEAASYLARAETALRNGDLIGARSLFTRLAQSGDRRGALGMARTYDEAEFKKMQVYGLKPDRNESELWRARAREMTSAVGRN